MACENNECYRDSCDGCPYNDDVSVDYGSLDFAQSEAEIPVYHGNKRVA
ncbi:hypothetical protein LCGC14_2376260 [marine sediment metagenome]|uniref:Uncharacterized protein n=1 Tax=marine sediment metagenome TaxID=412755 RepID=A0A0F9EEQ7_9ZZZZ